MPTISASGQDTVVIAGRVLSDVADGDYFTFTYNNELATVKRGKGGNIILASNSMGLVAEAQARVIRGSADDKFLNTLLTQQTLDFASFPLMTGQFVKRVGDGKGNVTNDTYKAEAGIFNHQVDAKSNAEGDTDQSVSVYRFTFGTGLRAIA